MDIGSKSLIPTKSAESSVKEEWCDYLEIPIRFIIFVVILYLAGNLFFMSEHLKDSVSNE
jgi:hypothetical protein